MVVGDAARTGFYINTITGAELSGSFRFFGQNNTTLIDLGTENNNIIEQISIGDTITLNRADGVSAVGVVDSTNTTLGTIDISAAATGFVATDAFTITADFEATDNPGIVGEGRGLSWDSMNNRWIPHAFGGEAWRSNNNYRSGDIVSFTGIIYQCSVPISTKAMNPLLTPTEWNNIITSINSLPDVVVGTAASQSFTFYTGSTGMVVDENFAVPGLTTGIISTGYTNFDGSTVTGLPFLPVMQGDTIRLRNTADLSQAGFFTVTSALGSPANIAFLSLTSGVNTSAGQRYVIDQVTTTVASNFPPATSDGFALTWVNSTQTWQPRAVAGAVPTTVDTTFNTTTRNLVVTVDGVSDNVDIPATPIPPTTVDVSFNETSRDLSINS